MGSYVYLCTLLPPLDLDVSPELPYEEFKELLVLNLSHDDMRKVYTIRRLYDLYNLLVIWRGHGTFSPYGNYDENQLKEFLVEERGLPSYVHEFAATYDKPEERAAAFPLLLQTYFHEEIRRSSGFLKKYLEFERSWRLVSTASRAKKLKRDLVVELQHENPEDPLVEQLLELKDSSSLADLEAHIPLVMLLEDKDHTALTLHRALSEYRMQKVYELTKSVIFGQDRPLGIICVLNYLIRLIIVEEWRRLDKQKGAALLKKIIEKVV